MPYRIYGGLSFYQRKEIKDVIAYCRLIVNHHDEEAFKRIINYPARGIGQTTLDKITIAASDNNISLSDVAINTASYGVAINKGTVSKINLFTDFIESLTAESEQVDAGAMMMKVIKGSGIMNEITQDNSPENMSRRENIEELLNGAQEFVNGRREEGGEENIRLSDFLQEVSLLSDIDESEDKDTKKINLMTVHSAKGVEFSCVFVVGLEEGLFPNQMSSISIRELEEERRLFYVALTRAEEYCFLTHAKSRYRYGKMEFSNESRFLSEIDMRFILKNENAQRDFISEKHYSDRLSTNKFSSFSTRTTSANHLTTSRITGLTPLSKLNTRQDNNTKATPSQQTDTTTTNTNSVGIMVGNIIEHERFGIGRVTKVEGTGENTKATVEFKNTGVKQLLLRFARFKVIE